MTDPEIRIAIAEACGWKYSGHCLWFRESDRIPDYLNDLNAMHEAEGNLDDKQWLTYLYWLSILQKATHLNESRCFAHAVAPVRAEAFLRAIGKWKD